MLSGSEIYKKCRSCDKQSSRPSKYGYYNYECSACRTGSVTKRTLNFYSVYNKIVESAYYFINPSNVIEPSGYLALILHNNNKILLSFKSMRGAGFYPPFETTITVSQPGFIGKIKSRSIKYGEPRRDGYIFRRYIINNDNNNTIEVRNLALVSIKYVEELDDLKWILL